MNGPDAPSNEAIDNDADLESHLADYSIGSRLVYACFGWGQSSEAAEVFRDLAGQHGVAVAMVSDDVEILRPS